MTALKAHVLRATGPPNRKGARPCGVCRWEAVLGCLLLRIHAQKYTHLHTPLALAPLSALHSIAGLTAAIVAVHVRLAAIELREGLVLVAAPAKLDAVSGVDRGSQPPLARTLAGRHRCCLPALKRGDAQVPPAVIQLLWLLVLLVLLVLVLLLLLKLVLWVLLLMLLLLLLQLLVVLVLMLVLLQL